MALRRALAIIGCMWLWATPAAADTHWVNGSNIGTEDGTTKATGYNTLQEGMAAMTGGDTLMIADGTYTGAGNMISNTYYPPSGSSGAFTVLQAETDGGVVFDGEGARNMFYVSTSAIVYCRFIGIVWGRSSTAAAAHIQGADADHLNSHIGFYRCGFYDGGLAQATSYNGLNMRYTEYGLVEDCYAWGELYYGILLEKCDYSVMRRCVSRMDIHRGSQGGPIGLYDVDDIEVQNCIIIDCDQPDAYTGVTYDIYGYSFVVTDIGSTNVHMRGCIALNLIADGEIVAGMVGENHASSGFTFDDVVMWGTSGGFWDRGSAYGTGIAVNHCLFGNSVGTGISEAFVGGSAVTNTIFLSNDAYGFGNDIPSQDYNCLYDNATDYRVSGDRGAHDYSAANSNAVDPQASGLLYPVRIETGSTLKTAGSSGGRIGPEILYAVGTSGTFYGETGYATTTGTSLWPYPNEATIKAKLAAYEGNTNGSVTGARGFCTGTSKDGSAQTLTKYIWEYLGNQIPADIYGSSSSASTGVGLQGVGWQ